MEHLDLLLSTAAFRLKRSRMESKVESPVPNGEPSTSTTPKGKTGVVMEQSVETCNEDSTVVKNGDGDANNSKGNSEASPSCSCNCSCQSRLEKLENEMNDLKNWKAGRTEFEDVITNWKDEVNKWMHSTFGFMIASTLTSKSEDVDLTPVNTCENNTKDFNPEDNTSAVTEGPGGDRSDILFNPEETENVEITPDLFGHFLLGNEYSHDDDTDDDVQEIDESMDDEESESEVPGDNLNIPEQPQPKRRKRNNDDSDSECFTLSSSSSDLESSDEDEYEPLPKRGRGRGRGRGMGPVNRMSPNKIRPNVGNSSTNKVNEDLGNVGSRKELLKYCRKRQGNIWECIVCGFMLTSFENMLLHIKYNHSSSTHTCPHCRIVVLCRSPKDAVLHQAQCKMRPDANSNNGAIKAPETKKIRPALPIPVAVVPSKPKGIAEINAEVDKLVADMLEPGGSSTNPVSSTKKNDKKTESPDIVTLSSDED